MAPPLHQRSLAPPAMVQPRTSSPSAGRLALAAEEAPRDHNVPQPVRTLRDWLDHLAARDRLAVADPGIALRFALAAIAKRLDGRRATLFPRPDGHPLPVVAGLGSPRQWIADAVALRAA